MFSRLILIGRGLDLSREERQGLRFKWIEELLLDQLKLDSSHEKRVLFSFEGTNLQAECESTPQKIKEALFLRTQFLEIRKSVLANTIP